MAHNTTGEIRAALERRGVDVEYHRGRLVAVDPGDGVRYHYVPEMGAWYGRRLYGMNGLALSVVPALAKDGTPDPNPWPEDRPAIEAGERPAFNVGEVEPGCVEPEDAKLLASLFGRPGLALSLTGQIAR